MLRNLTKAIGYAKAPKATYVLRHPQKGLTALAMYKGMKTRPAQRLATGMLGLAALGLALPVGLYLANR